MNQRQQIAELNTRTKATLALSPIHGIGVFPLRDIAKGEKLYLDAFPSVYHIPYGSLSKLFPYVREELLRRWPSIVNGSKFIWPDTRLLSYMNHSDMYNYDPVTDEALTDIKVGEEITENYRMMENWQKVFPWLTK